MLSTAYFLYDYVSDNSGSINFVIKYLKLNIFQLYLTYNHLRES